MNEGHPASRYDYQVIGQQETPEAIAPLLAHASKVRVAVHIAAEPECAKDVERTITGLLEVIENLQRRPRADLDTLTREQLAARNADWQQVAQNGGPPCFALDGERFCLRSDRWPGHNAGQDHRFVSLEELLRAAPPRG